MALHVPLRRSVGWKCGMEYCAHVTHRHAKVHACAMTCAPPPVSCDASMPLPLCHVMPLPLYCIDGAVQLTSGYIRLESSFFGVNSLLLTVRTRSADTVLVSLGDIATLVLQQGSLVYVRRNTTQSGNYLTAITMATHAHISDGLWHRIELTVGDTHTRVCRVGVACRVSVVLNVPSAVVSGWWAYL